MVCSSFYDKENTYSTGRVKDDLLQYNLGRYNKFIKFINCRSNKDKHNNLLCYKLIPLYSRYNLKDY